MRFRKLPRLLIVALALLLVGGQQAAFAHMVAHLAEYGDASAAAVIEQGDDEHGAALTLSHVCTTCLTLDAFAVPLPASAPLEFGDVVVAAPQGPVPAAAAAVPPRRYAARAPPVSL